MRSSILRSMSCARLTLLIVSVALLSARPAEAINNPVGHYVGADYSGAGNWNNRHATFNDAVPVALGGQFNTTPTTGVSINGHGTIFFDANNDANLRTGGAFRVLGSVAVSAGGTNPSSGARRITLSAVFQTRGGIGGVGGAHWQNSGLLGNEQPGGNRGDWGLTYQDGQAQGFQSDVETVSPTGGFNNNLPHIVSYNIDNAGNTTLWVDGRLETTIGGGANFLAADINRTLDTGSASSFSIGVSTGADVGSNAGDNGFIHGDLAEARIDSFAAPSTGASVNLSPAEIVLLHNHLSSKYASVMTANDFYAGDTGPAGDYDNGVTGIVGITATKVSSSNDQWLTSLASSGLTVNELNSSVGDNEGVLAGHDDFLDTTVPTATVIAGVLSRVWFVDETGAVDFSLTFDLGDLGVSFPQTPSLLFAPTVALNFANTGIAGVVNGDQITFDLTTFTGGDGYFTLGGAGVPEPASMSLLALGGAMLLRRRRTA